MIKLDSMRRSMVRHWRRWIVVGVVAVLAIVTMTRSAQHGWGVRKAAWDYFEPGRHGYDIGRNYYFGTVALRDGLLNMYDDQQAHPPRDAIRLNYTPLRTVVFARWAASNGEPDVTPANRQPRVEREWEFNRYLNTFNYAIALAGAIAAALLVLQWTLQPRTRLLLSAPHLCDDDLRSSARPGAWQRTRGRLALALDAAAITWHLAWPWIAATIAFAAFWYNPAGLILGHGWPSPNAWVIPCYLWALVFITWDMWFIGGVAIGIGSMLQGQHLLVAPIFVLWPLFAFQPLRAARWVAGFGIAFTGTVAGWLLTLRPDPEAVDRVINREAVAWMISSAVVLAAIPLLKWGLSRLGRHRQTTQSLPTAGPDDDLPVDTVDPADSPAETADTAPDAPPARRWLPGLIMAIGACIALGIVLWPLVMRGAVAGPIVFGAALWTLALLCLVWFKGWRIVRYAVPLLIAIQLLLCMPLYGASDSWLDVGFLYGTERHPHLAVGPANNLGGLLRESYGFRAIDELLWTIEPGGLGLGLPRTPVNIDMRTFMAGLYGITLLLASIAIALQWRRRDRNFLLAVTVPWLLMALLPAQMHERYLGFAGCAAAVWIGARGGIGWALLGAFISAVAYSQTGRSMFNYRAYPNLDRPFFDREFFQLVGDATPDLSWALLLAAAIVLGASFMSSRPRSATLAARPAEDAGSADGDASQPACPQPDPAGSGPAPAEPPFDIESPFSPAGLNPQPRA